MNVAAHQKEKNEKMGKRKSGRERRQADFKEAACYPSAIVQGLHSEKMFYVRGVPGVTGIFRKANSHFNQHVSESTRVLGTNRKSVMMNRVKVSSKSELIDHRDGKSAPYGVICCCDDRLLSRVAICGHTVQI